MRSILVGEVRTGRRITQIPVSDASWSMVHRGPGEVTIDIPLDAEDFRVLEREWFAARHFGDFGEYVSPTTYTSAAVPLWRPGDGMRPELLAALEPVRCFLAVVEDDIILEAGPIWAWEYQYGGVLQVRAVGMRSLFDHRFMVNGDAAIAWAEWAVTYSGLSLGTIAKRSVELTESQSGGGLPIVLPDDVAGDQERTYRGHELKPVGAAIDELMGAIDGPDISFEPRFTEDRLGVEWVMRIGDPMLSQAGDDHVWDCRVPQSPISGLSVSRDATRVATRSWATGAGLDEARWMARRGPANLGMEDLRDVGFPLTEVSEAQADVEDQLTLNRAADGNLRAGSRPWQTWTADAIARPVAVLPDGTEIPAGPQLGQYRPGDYARIWIPQTHPLLGMLLPEGFHRARIMDISGGMGDQVKLTFAPNREAR